MFTLQCVTSKNSVAVALPDIYIYFSPFCRPPVRPFNTKLEYTYLYIHSVLTLQN